MTSFNMPLDSARPLGIFQHIDQFELEGLHFCSRPDDQLQAIIAIHNTKLGPALGGCRFIEYDCERDALWDVARLAKGMSYKAALAKVPQGGGKSVILKPAHIKDRAALYRAFGRFVDSLGGQYITAIDSGTSLSDMDEVAAVTSHVAGSHKDGLDPSPITALGVFSGIQAAARHRLGSDELTGMRIAIQGLGNVGYALAQLLHDAGAQLLVADIDQDKVKRVCETFSAEAVDPEQIDASDCEVFAPCGLGAVVNDWSIDQLKCQVIAGSANNQLAETYHGKLLHEQNILYAPDYVINAGGLINVSMGLNQATVNEIRDKTLDIGSTLTSIFERSTAKALPTSMIADELAEEILAKESHQE